MPFDGDLLEQPAWAVDLIQLAENTFEAVKASREEANMLEMRKQMEKGRAR